MLDEIVERERHRRYWGLINGLSTTPSDYEKQPSISQKYHIPDPSALLYSSKQSDYFRPRAIFYVHQPSWVDVRDASAEELGFGVLGTAHVFTGRIRLLYSLQGADRDEVLLHENFHVLYPMHSERQIRDLVRDTLGAENCRFH